jgi:hypothetical protein
MIGSERIHDDQNHIWPVLPAAAGKEKNRYQEKNAKANQSHLLARKGI